MIDKGLEMAIYFLMGYLGKSREEVLKLDIKEVIKFIENFYKTNNNIFDANDLEEVNDDEMV